MNSSVQIFIYLQLPLRWKFFLGYSTFQQSVFEINSNKEGQSHQEIRIYFSTNNIVSRSVVVLLK